MRQRHVAKVFKGKMKIIMYSESQWEDTLQQAEKKTM
jgi:hypothetical protein